MYASTYMVDVRKRYRLLVKTYLLHIKYIKEYTVGRSYVVRSFPEVS